MTDADNLNTVVSRPVENHIVTNGETAEAGSHFLTATAYGAYVKLENLTNSP